MIVGRDVLRAFGIKLDFETDKVVANGISRPMRAFPTPTDELNSVDILLQEYLDNVDPIFNDENDKFSDKVLIIILTFVRCSQGIRWIHGPTLLWCFCLAA